MTTQPASPDMHANQDNPGPAVSPPGSMEPPDTTRPDAGPDELMRLREELSMLHARLDTRRRRASVIRGVRGFAAMILIAITAFALVTTVVGVWAARTVMNTDRWVATVAPLPQNPQVAAAVASYATDQLFQAIDVEQRLQAVLPQQAAFIAGPVSGQVRTAVRNTVYNVLQSDRFQPIWVELNRRAHARAVAILNGSSDVAVVRQDRVDIDLLPLINQVLVALSAQLPTLFGKQLNLPDLSSGAIPDNLRNRVQDALGVTLPANFAQFTVYDSNQLWVAQQAVATAKKGLILSVVGTVVLLALALLVSARRRRTLLHFGLWLIAVAVAISAVLRAVRGQVLGEVPAGVYRDGVAATFATVFDPLRDRGTLLIVLGAILVPAMYLIGPGRGAVWARHQGAVGTRWAMRGGRAGGHALVTHGPGWTARYLDALRIGGLIVAAVLALILTSWTALLVIAVALAVFEVGVTLVGRWAARRSSPSEAGSDVSPAAAS
jgi:hypothetical protein